MKSTDKVDLLDSCYFRPTSDMRKSLRDSLQSVIYNSFLKEIHYYNINAVTRPAMVMRVNQNVQSEILYMVQLAIACIDVPKAIRPQIINKR
jgi:hypothetical protein